MGNWGSDETRHESSQDVVQFAFITKKMFDGSQLNIIQSHDLYQHYKQILMQVENFCLTHPYQKCPSIVNIYQPNNIRHLMKIGFYHGNIYAILFDDDMLCLMFEHLNRAYDFSLRVLDQWRSCDRKSNRLRLTTIESNDFRRIFWVTSASLEPQLNSALHRKYI
jgi:hypothetical protein